MGTIHKHDIIHDQETIFERIFKFEHCESYYRKVQKN